MTEKDGSLLLKAKNLTTTLETYEKRIKKNY